MYHNSSGYVYYACLMELKWSFMCMPGHRKRFSCLGAKTKILRFSAQFDVLAACHEARTYGVQIQAHGGGPGGRAPGSS